jgi:hypothetical protein
MSALSELITASGTLQGSSRLQDPNTGQSEDSISLLTVTPNVGDASVTLHYTWSYQGAPQEGTLRVVGTSQNQFKASWTDTWHMGEETMGCSGAAHDAGLSLLGSYAAPPGPDWYWRIVIQVGSLIEITMYNISPEGQEDLAVEAVYRR